MFYFVYPRLQCEGMAIFSFMWSVLSFLSCVHLLGKLS